VYAGGGECGLDNVRTLCVPCHAAVTASQASPAVVALLLSLARHSAHLPRARTLRRRPASCKCAPVCMWCIGKLENPFEFAPARANHLPLSQQCSAEVGRARLLRQRAALQVSPGRRRRRLPTAPSSAAPPPQQQQQQHPLLEADRQRCDGGANGRRLRVVRAGAFRLRAGRLRGLATRASRRSPPLRVP
jgi:hypothetical protein